MSENASLTKEYDESADTMRAVVDADGSDFVQSAESALVLLSQHLPDLFREVDSLRASGKSVHFVDLTFRICGRELDDQEFWAEASDHESLWPRMRECASEMQTQLAETDCLWIDDETPVGQNLAFELAKIETSGVRTYTAFLRHWDNDHEVYQADQIDEIVERYGCCDETLELLAVRSGIALGQEGFDQVSQLLPRDPFRSTLREDPSILRRFLLESLLADYLAFYGAKMRADGNCSWPQDYCIETFDDMIEILEAPQDLAKELRNEARQLIKECYDSLPWK